MAQLESDETELTQELYRNLILKAGPDERFDRLSRMLARQFAAPVALISLMDRGHQWCLANFGLDTAQLPSLNPFCKYAVRQEKAFLVEAADKDARFAKNEMVTGPTHIRSYAGLSLKTDAGEIIGTIGIFDKKARSFGADDLAALEDFAACVEREVLDPQSQPFQAMGFLSAIVDNLPELVFVKDAKELRYRLFNRAGENLFGISRWDLIGKNDFEFFPEEQARKFYEQDSAALANEEVTDIPEQPLNTTSAGRRYLRTRKVAIRNSDGEPAFLLGISKDITRDKEIQRELTMALKAAERASRVKSEFLAHMSHELRTPLNAILGFAGVMSNQIFGKVGHVKYEGYLDDIQHSGYRLLHLLNDLLDLSRIESGNYEIFEEIFDLNIAARSCLEKIKGRKEAQAITFQDDLPDNPTLIRADERAVKQVILNLLANAVKYNEEEGEVRLVVRADDAGAVTLTVSDTGVGIAMEDIERVLMPFNQIRKDSLEAHDGAGLGLTLSNQLINLHGGKLTIESEKEKGTTVTVGFPPERQVEIR